MARAKGARGERMSRQLEDRQDRDGSSLVFVVMVLVVLVLMVAGYFLIQSFIPFKGRGTFADMYGAIVGTLFGGLAFAGLILTIRIQQRELRETREELARTANAQDAHVKVAQLAARLDAATVLRQFYIDEHLKVSSTSWAQVDRNDEIELLLKRLDNDAEEALSEMISVRDELRDFVRQVKGNLSDTSEDITGTAEASDPPR